MAFEMAFGASFGTTGDACVLKCSFGRTMTSGPAIGTSTGVSFLKKLTISPWAAFWLISLSSSARICSPSSCGWATETALSVAEETDSESEEEDSDSATFLRKDSRTYLTVLEFGCCGSFK